MKKILTIAALVAAAPMMLAQGMSPALNKLLNAQYAIQQFYVDTVNENKLVEGAIKGMLEQLDPHSSYTDASETRELEEPLQGEFSGIGVQFNMKQDTLYVIQTVPGGPSERVGILAGDRIVTVNDTSIAGVKMKNTAIMKRLRGKKGTKVTVQVKRRGVPELITFRITRDKIPVNSIDASYMVDDTVGYMRISRFGTRTCEEMVENIEKLEKLGMRRLIIDMSDNGGGYLNAAIEMCNEFLNPGQLIVYTQGDRLPRSEAHAAEQGLGRGKYRNLPIVVMVNQYSASAAEIFAGAMQDWDRAPVVGRRSFGKGLVQRPFHFQDGSMIRLTVARYYTPAGRCIQKAYKMGERKAYEDDLSERVKDGELYHQDSIHVVDSLKTHTLRTARTVYGGGGIIPDVFVPLDTSEYSTYYRDLVAKGIINQFAISYVDEHRSDLKARYKTVHDFDRNFRFTEADMQRLIDMGEKDNVHYDAEKYRTSERLITTIARAFVARDVYSEPGAYSVIVNHRNPDYNTALDIIRDPSRYHNILGDKVRVESEE